MDHQRKSCKVAASLFRVFEVALSMHDEWITNQKVVKLLSLYIKCLKSCKVVESLYQGVKVGLYMCQELITKNKVVKL